MKRLLILGLVLMGLVGCSSKKIYWQLVEEEQRMQDEAVQSYLDTNFSSQFAYENWHRITMKLYFQPADSVWYRVESENYYILRNPSMIDIFKTDEMFKDSLVESGGWYSDTNRIKVVLR